ncbi:MAG TPA: heavy metal translocating P-type ATPase [Gemmatimonadaceae bacterium]|nr:heavy metal translocating P-type ATPase [Gemmatimonadaceae bacterium]
MATLLAAERAGPAQAAPAAPAADEARTSCAHCGLPVPPGFAVAGSARPFCCAGCRTAFAIIHAHGLAEYYGFAERREAPVTPSGRRYEEFDHETFRALYVRSRGDGLSETDLYLEGVHCASCVWLIERVPLAMSGVARAELDVGRSLAHVVWDPTRTTLSTVARFLDALGYAPHPFRGVKADAMRRREDRAALTNIGIAGAIAGNVMLIALAIYAGWFGGIEREFERYFRWWSFLLTTPAILGPGRVFFRGAWGALRARALHMDVPIALALAAGYLRGAANTVRDSGPVYFDGVVTLIFLLLVGRFLQRRAQRAATDSAELLFALAPSTARVVEESGAVREVPVEAVLPGAVLDVRAGDTLAADGVVTEGRSALDLALLTGESRPVAAAAGDAVFAGTVNLSAPLRVRVTGAGEASRLGRLLRDVEESARRRAPIVRLADRLAGVFVAVVLALAGVTWALWFPRDPALALDNAIAMLIVTCPCALALATPLAMTVAIGRAARQGILIKGGDALERLARPGRLILDKTGTLTEGRLALVAWEGLDEARALVLALERHSRHPIALALQRAWPEVHAPTAQHVVETIGGGLEGRVGGRLVVVGKPAFVLARGAHTPRVRAPFAPLDEALSPVLVRVADEIVARAAFGDPVRAEAKEAVAELRARGWRVSILSGDDPRVVAAVARAVGVPGRDARGGATPEEKHAEVERLVARVQGALAGETVVQGAGAGETVVMVGDGVNDAAAIAAASVGIGVRGSAEASLAAADVYLARGGLAPLLALERGARRTLNLIRLGVAFSLAYNVAGAALALTGMIDPLVAAIVMPASSLTVVLTAWHGRTFSGAAP